MKRIFLIILMINSFIISGYTQNAGEDDKNLETKHANKTLITAGAVKIENFKLPSINLDGGGICEARLEKMTTDNGVSYFYQITNSLNFTGYIASIEYNDLMRIIRAIPILKSQSEKDVLNNPEYLENKYVTTDGFQFGYFIKDSKCKWFIRLESIGANNILLLKDVNATENAFIVALNKREQIGESK